MSAIDVADHVGIGFEDHVFVDQARSRNRRTAGVNRALYTVLPGPRNHTMSGGAVLYAAKSNLAQEFDSRGSQFFEVIFNHALLQHRRPSVDFHASRPKILEGSLRKDRHCLQSDDIFRAAWRMHFSGGDHRGDTTMQTAIDPAELILTRRPIAADGMYVAVDQSWGQCRALGVDCCGGAALVQIFLFAYGVDVAVNRDNRIRVENRTIEVAAQKEPNVADHKFGRNGRLRGGVLSHAILSLRN